MMKRGTSEKDMAAADAGMTRRGFLVGAATVGAVAAAGALAGCSPQSENEETGTEGDTETGASSWLGNEPETPESFDEEITADVVVLGAGIAGVAACRSAIEEGVSVAVFEKSSGVAGRSSDFMCLGSSWIETHFPSIPPMSEVKWDLIHSSLKGSLNRPKDAIWARWADMNGQCFDWWIGAIPDDELSSGSEENDNVADTSLNNITINTWPMPSSYDPSGELYPCYAGTAKLYGANTSSCRGFVQANFDVAISEGGGSLSYYFDARAEKLLTDESGRVTGAIIRGYDGTVYRANANKAVVLATGDFINNPDMMAEFCRREVNDGYTQEKSLYTTYDVEGNPCNVGDGHKMASWIGARMQSDGCCMTHMGRQEVDAIGADPCLWLNTEGLRFMNEDCQACHMSQRLMELPETTIYQIFDGNILDQLDQMPYGHRHVVSQTQEGLDEAVEAGALLRGDTLEELFSQLGNLDVDAALESVERYNEMCAQGRDDDFGKRADRLFPVDTAPYYCVVWQDCDSLVTLTGLESDEECRVYDEDFKVIEGLYVCGNTQGNRWALEYAETGLGLSHAMAMTYGYIAGKNAANA